VKHFVTKAVVAVSVVLTVKKDTARTAEITLLSPHFFKPSDHYPA
jgi:hypothetical protein